MRVSVIIPARDAETTLGDALEALSDQRLSEPYELIVVDDGSEDRTAEVAERAAGRVRLLRQDAMGPAVARNRGVAAAAAPLLAFTDADCVPGPEWLAAGLRALERAELVQGAVRPAPGARVGPFDRTISVGAEVGLYETANLFCTRELFERIGGFEDWLKPRRGKQLAEDIWFGWRARRAGARTAFSADAVVHHAVFRRGPLGYVAERRRLLYFPAIAARVPELRRTLFFARYFLNRRTAAFDAAVAAVTAARLSSSPLPLVAGAPYVRLLAGRARAFGARRAPAVAAVDLVADAVGLGSLLVGGLRARSLLL